MHCHHFVAGRCRSCPLIEVPRHDQVEAKQTRVGEELSAAGALEWLPPVAGAGAGFRNKAKMVVSGTVDAPVLGIWDPTRGGVDLQDCPLHTPGLQAALPVLAEFVTTAALVPYDVAARRGELKHLLVTEAPDGALMVRFVLRSTEAVARIRKHLPGLRAALPDLAVASVNLQPEHKAVLEGPDEVLLLGETLTMTVNEVPLHLRPQSFFQTNTEVAAALYRDARAWIDELVLLPAGARVWDLYGGVGGFALHLAAPGRQVVGVEVSEQAVASARRTAAELGLDDSVEFVAADATAWARAQQQAPDLVVVNPPRRGIGVELAGWLESSGVRAVLYSSCHVTTLARDLAAMPSLRPVRARLLDMFPHTDHHEVLVLLERTGEPGDRIATDE